MHSNGNKLLSYNLWLFSALVTFCECLVCDVDYVEVVLLLLTIFISSVQIKGLNVLDKYIAKS